jgi:hypothetical protein
VDSGNEKTEAVPGASGRGAVAGWAVPGTAGTTGTAVTGDEGAAGAAAGTGWLAGGEPDFM